MKILYLATDVYGANGGIAQFNRDSIRAISQYDLCSQLIVLPYHLHGSAPPYPRLEFSPPAVSGNRAAYIRHALSKVSSLGKKDLIICGHISFAPLAYLMHLLSGAPFVLVIYGIDAWGKNKNPIMNFFSAKASALISISEFTKDNFLSWCRFKNKKYILPCSIDMNTFSPGPKNQKLADRYHLHGKKIILTLARLASPERYKGIDEILEIMPELLRSIPELVYVIAGEGDDRLRLEAKSRKLGIADEVIFTGFVREEEKADYYRLSDLFAMPGRGEGFGIVYLEAIACGTPALGSKLDGSKEALMDGKLGILVNPDSRTELIEGILRGLASPKGQAPEKLNYFNFEIFSDRLRQILSNFSS